MNLDLIIEYLDKILVVVCLLDRIVQKIRNINN